MTDNIVSEDTTIKEWHGAGTPPQMAWNPNIEPTEFPSSRNSNLHDHVKTGTSIPYTNLYG